MNTTNVIPLPVSEISMQMAKLAQDVDDLLDVFRELYEVEKMIGKAGLSARVRVSFMNILSSADKAVRV